MEQLPPRLPNLFTLFMTEILHLPWPIYDTTTVKCLLKAFELSKPICGVYDGMKEKVNLI